MPSLMTVRHPEAVEAAEAMVVAVMVATAMVVAVIVIKLLLA